MATLVLCGSCSTERPAHVLFVGNNLAPGVEFTVTVEHNQLYVQLTDQAAFPVYATSEDHFFYTVVHARLQFQRDGDGKVSALVLDQDGRKQRAPRQRSAAVP